MPWYDKAIINSAMYVICVCTKSDYLAHRWERRYLAWRLRLARARAEARAWRDVRRWLASEANRPR